MALMTDKASMTVEIAFPDDISNDEREHTMKLIQTALHKRLSNKIVITIEAASMEELLQEAREIDAALEWRPLDVTLKIKPKTEMSGVAGGVIQATPPATPMHRELRRVGG
jgi:vacuolar-type H+-ATPase subunit E/Vma4